MKNYLVYLVGILYFTGSLKTVAAAGPMAPGIEARDPVFFKTVTSQLDAGGDFFLYYRAEQCLAGLSDIIAAWQTNFANLPGLNELDRENIRQVFELIRRLVQRSGVEEIKGVGASGIALDQDLFRYKFLLYRHPEKKQGCLWSVFGSAPHALTALDFLPTNTVAAKFTDIDLAQIWSILHQEITQAGPAEWAAAWETIPDEFEKNFETPFREVLASLGGEVGSALTLDESVQVPLPLPLEHTITIPAPDLMLMIKVTNAVLFDLVDRQLARNKNLNPIVIRVNEPGLRMLTVPVPIPLPVDFRPTLALSGQQLFLATSDRLVREALAVKQGRKPGLKITGEFQRLSASLPTEGNYFIFTSQQLSRHLARILHDLGQALPSEAAFGLNVARQFYGLDHLPYGYTVGANTDLGWAILSHSSQKPSSKLFASTMAIPAFLLTSIAIPNFFHARTAAQMNACINNLRMIDGAKQQWALENRKSGKDQPTMKDLLPYLRREPVCPQGGTYTIGIIDEKPTCSHPGHALP